MLSKNLFALVAFYISFFCSVQAFSQNTSNKGTDFWIAYSANSDNTASRLSLFLTSTTNATVNITAGGQALSAVNLIAGQAIPVVIDPNVYTNAYIIGTDVIQKNAGIHVTSDVPIIVYAHMSNAARSASSLILPVRALGNEYYALAYTQNSSSREALSEFTIVGVEDNTTIQITPTVNSSGNTKFANKPFQVTLNKGDVYQYKSSTDVTGSYIKTIGDCKPVAVFSGSTFAAYCEAGNNKNAPSGDPLYQQLFPVSAWGKNFVTAPFYNAQHGASDIIRIQVAKDNTTIKVNGSAASALGTSLSNPYKAGSVITFPAAASTRIEADLPISVAQIQVSQACNPNNSPTVQFPGDPEITVLNPVEQTLKDITVYSAVSYPAAPTVITRHYLNIILKTTDIPNLKVDGNIPTGTFVTIDSEYSYITVDVTASSAVNPAHRITSSEGFIAIAYGYGNPESYAYLAGADLKNLNANIVISAPGTTDPKSELCTGESYEVTLQLPYITEKIIWNLKNGLKKDTLTAPPYTSATSNGITSYFYKYNLAAATISTAGAYDLKATVLNPAPTSCNAEEEVSTSFVVYNLPTAAFTTNSQSACRGKTITFTDSSSGNGSSITKWIWDFGDGINETKISAAPFDHIFLAEGDYNVTLRVESDKGCSSSLSQTYAVHVFKAPEAKFAVSSPACEKQQVTFTDQSIANEGNIVSWIWDFGDSTAVTATNNSPVMHTYGVAGSFKVTLSVITDKGCESGVFTSVIDVRPLPRADFETPDVCLSDAFAQFKNLTTISDLTDADLSYLWNFGDPSSGALNISTQKDPKHKYLRAALYTVTLTITSKFGCAITVSKDFTVNGATPRAGFVVKNNSNLCSNQPVEFEDHATVDFGAVTRIEWYYDYTNNPSLVEVDDSPGVRNGGEKLYSHIYPKFTAPASKSYMVRMIAYSGSSCVDDEIQTITIRAVPNVNFDVPDACLANGTALFSDRSTIAGTPGPFTYQWDFGDGNASAQNPNVSTGAAPSHAYSSAGTYLVSLTVTAGNGCSETLSKSVMISGSIPEPEFTVLNENSLCSSDTVTFEDQTTIAFGQLTRIEWYFDETDHPNDPGYQIIDSNPVSQSNLSKQYEFKYPTFHSPMTRTVTVRQKVFSGDCVKEITKNIVLKAVPEVAFNAINPICEEAPVIQLTQAAEMHNFPGSGVYSGTGVTSSGVFDPKAAGPGTHVLTYTFTGSNGCTDQRQQPLIVYPTPAVYLGQDIQILDGGQVTLNPPTATGSNLTYKWTPSIGLSRDDILNPVVSPSEDITYTLTVTTDNGCSASDDIFVKVLKGPEVPRAFTPNNDGVNDVWTIKYLDSYPGCSVNVYNRYGTNVFSAVGYPTPWDGRYKGENLPAGTYYYVIDPKNGRKIMTGSVTILR